ncbi:two-component system response regulator YesN [Salirhabdus euzebyi]|uniref:Two-component system response regulator YesN n=1 Tax=Salirhabdus euzebyi TaxID=394506 RepID=A0A841Q862_9BACI|nr:response regulator [Salirhabdus euzebyi]MBB6454600.1 two-component system response regulator YesN [Salirhabdus euzebyi]
MFKLLIVDDEWTIREGLEKTIPWEEWGLQVVGTAKNGFEALDMLEARQTDVLLTDIRMPGMSGLDLIATCKDKYPSLKMIILTGHDEFEYAQKAIKLGADDFLLKPTNVDELKETMLNITKTLKEQQTEKADLIALVVKDYIEHHQEEHLTKLQSFETLKAKYGMMIIESDNLHPANRTNCLLIDKKDNKEMYLFHSIENEAQWDTILSDYKAEFADCESKVELSCSLLTSELDQLVSIYKQANVASMSYCEQGNVTIYKYRDEKYTLDFEDVLMFINQHYMEPLNQVEMAKKLHMSNSYFSRLFKQHTGMNFVDYVTNKRLEVAKDLLKTTKLKTYEIANEVGFVEARYFGQLFKKHEGCTPGDYRRKFEGHVIS